MRDEPDRTAASRADSPEALAGVAVPTEKAELQIVFLEDDERVTFYRESGRAGLAGESVRWFLKVRDRWRHPGRGPRAGGQTGRPVAAGKKVPQVAESTPTGTIIQKDVTAEDPVTASATPDDMMLAALYLEAERVCLPHEAPYDTDGGLQRFSAWLDDRIGPHDEADC
jgi:hypothetical protein